jgi:hypothetical protein
MAMQYYYFIAGLPGISLDDTKLSYTPEQFRRDAAAQLSEKDFALLMLLHLPEDMQNLLGYLYKDDRDPDPEGIYAREFWEEFRLYLLARVENRDLDVAPQFSDYPLLSLTFWSKPYPVRICLPESRWNTSCFLVCSPLLQAP